MSLARWMVPLALLGMLADARAAEKKIKIEDLPKAVARAAKKAFPEARVVAAAREKNDEGETVFEVELKLDGKSVDLTIDEEGEIEAIEKEIEPEDLPRAVLKAVKTKFPRAKITRVEEVTDEDDKVVYELAFSPEGKKSFEVVMAPNGKIVGSEDEEKGQARKKGKDDDKKASKKQREDDEPKNAKKKEREDDDPKSRKKKEKDDDEKDGKKEKPKS